MKYTERRLNHGKSKSNCGHQLMQGLPPVCRVCPVKAIEPLTEINKKGYEIIRIDEETCIGCGQCYKICPDYVFTIE